MHFNERMNFKNISFSHIDRNLLLKIVVKNLEGYLPTTKRFNQVVENVG
jgi:hypothetical protein